MSVYEVNRLMAETRRLAAEYYRITKQILPVSGELACHDVIRLLDLYDSSTVQKGVNAFGTGVREGQRIQIKSRVLFDKTRSNYRIGQLSLDGDWTHLMVMLYDEQYEPLEIYSLTRAQIETELGEHYNPKRDKRGAMSVAKIRIIGERIWIKPDKN